MSPDDRDEIDIGGIRLPRADWEATPAGRALRHGEDFAMVYPTKAVASRAGVSIFGAAFSLWLSLVPVRLLGSIGGGRL